MYILYMHFTYYCTIIVKRSLKMVEYYLQEDDGYNNIIYTYSVYYTHYTKSSAIKMTSRCRVQWTIRNLKMY